MSMVHYTDTHTRKWLISSVSVSIYLLIVVHWEPSPPQSTHKPFNSFRFSDSRKCIPHAPNEIDTWDEYSVSCTFRLHFTFWNSHITEPNTSPEMHLPLKLMLEIISESWIQIIYSRFVMQWVHFASISGMYTWCWFNGRAKAIISEESFTKLIANDKTLCFGSIAGFNKCLPFHAPCLCIDMNRQQFQSERRQQLCFVSVDWKHVLNFSHIPLRKFKVSGCWLHYLNFLTQFQIVPKTVGESYSFLKRATFQRANVNHRENAIFPSFRTKEVIA